MFVPVVRVVVLPPNDKGEYTQLPVLAGVPCVHSDDARDAIYDTANKIRSSDPERAKLIAQSAYILNSATGRMEEVEV